MYVAGGSKLRSGVRPSMHPYPANLVEIVRAVAYYARADHTFSAGIKCRHCTIEESFTFYAVCICNMHVVCASLCAISF